MLINRFEMTRIGPICHALGRLIQCFLHLTKSIVVQLNKIVDPLPNLKHLSINSFSTFSVPPGLPEIFWKEKQVMSSIGPLAENERVKLICKSKGGFPSAKVTWWKQGRLIEAEPIEQPQDGLSASLISIVASRSMLDVPLICHARSSHPDQSLSRPRTTAVTLDILCKYSLKKLIKFMHYVYYCTCTIWRLGVYLLLV